MQQVEQVFQSNYANIKSSILLTDFSQELVHHFIPDIFIGKSMVNGTAQHGLSFISERCFFFNVKFLVIRSFYFCSHCIQLTNFFFLTKKRRHVFGHLRKLIKV